MQAKLSIIEKEVVSVVKESVVTITLSWQEASDLMTLCGNIAGKHPEHKYSENHIRRTTDPLYIELKDLSTLKYDPEILRGAILADT